MANAPDRNRDRYHALDCLRGFAMFLGVVLHAAISFMPEPPAFWSVRDRNPEPLTGVFLFAVHNFRMQAFFLLAGFFGCLLYRRYSLAGMALHRLKRVAVPFVLGMLFIVPTVMAAFLYVELENVRTEGVPPGASPAREFAAGLVAEAPEKGNARLLAERFTTGGFLTLLPLAHLWFLYYLLYFYAAVLLLAPLLGRLTGTRFLRFVDGAFRRLVEGRWRALLPALLMLPVLLAMQSWFVDTPLGWRPEWHLLGYYFAFFAFGWMLYRQRELVTSFGRRWRLNLVLANVVVFPVATVLTLGGMEQEKAGAAGVAAWRVGGFAAQSAYTWLMVAGLWGAFLHWFARERAWVRYMADASYWCYLASITPIVVLQYWVKDWPLPGLVKWALVTAATMAVLLASYEWLVRYTFVGAILNGRKYRTRAEAKESGEEAKVAAGAK